MSQQRTSFNSLLYSNEFLKKLWTEAQLPGSLESVFTAPMLVQHIDEKRTNCSIVWVGSIGILESDPDRRLVFHTQEFEVDSALRNQLVFLSTRDIPVWYAGLSGQPMSNDERFMMGISFLREEADVL